MTFEIKPHTTPSYLDMVKGRIRGIDGTFNKIHNILIAGDVRSIPVVNPDALHRERVRLVNIRKQLLEDSGPRLSPFLTDWRE